MKIIEISDETYERMRLDAGWTNDDTVINDLADLKLIYGMHHKIILLFPELKTYDLHRELKKIAKERPWDNYENIDHETGTKNILYVYKDGYKHGIDIGPIAHLVHDNDLITEGKIQGWELASVEELKRLSPEYGKI